MRGARCQRAAIARPQADAGPHPTHSQHDALAAVVTTFRHVYPSPLVATCCDRLLGFSVACEYTTTGPGFRFAGPLTRPCTLPLPPLLHLFLARIEPPAYPRRTPLTPAQPPSQPHPPAPRPTTSAKSSTSTAPANPVAPRPPTPRKTTRTRRRTRRRAGDCSPTSPPFLAWAGAGERRRTTRRRAGAGAAQRRPPSRQRRSAPSACRALVWRTGSSSCIARSLRVGARRRRRSSRMLELRRCPKVRTVEEVCWGLGEAS